MYIIVSQFIVPLTTLRHLRYLIWFKKSTFYVIVNIFNWLTSLVFCLASLLLRKHPFRLVYCNEILAQIWMDSLTLVYWFYEGWGWSSHTWQLLSTFTTHHTLRQNICFKSDSKWMIERMNAWMNNDLLDWGGGKDTKVIPVMMIDRNSTRNLISTFAELFIQLSFCLGLLKKVGGLTMWQAVGGTDRSGIFAPALFLSPWLWTAWYTPASGHQSKQPFSLRHTPPKRGTEGVSPPHENNLLPNPNEIPIHVWVPRMRRWAQGWVLHPKTVLLRVKPLHLEAHQKPNSLLLIVRINLSSNIHCMSKSMWTSSSIMHEVLTCTKPESRWTPLGARLRHATSRSNQTDALVLE